jgi:hypothetical protein
MRSRRHGALTRQNGEFDQMWEHHDHASDNAMELQAAIGAFRILPKGMVV